MTTHPVPDPVALNKAFAEEVRVLLARRKVSQKAVQDALGWSRAKVNRLVNAEQEWGMSEMLAICDYLDVDLSVILSTAKAVERESSARGALQSQRNALALAAQLTAEREAAGLTVDELAQRASINEGALSDILDGKRPADANQLDAICKALGVTLLEVFARTEERMRADEQGDGRQASGK